ncbi:MAG: type II toxin-antitoxin system VapB family antitoxin, partial [Dehalococcoidia bacterium]|nr:type II toxin-antitoxin system VapB family antitoxin [Dehalococcoidia bacterium]
MRTTLNIDDDLLKEAKIMAVREGTTLTALLERALR